MFLDVIFWVLHQRIRTHFFLPVLLAVLTLCILMFSLPCFATGYEKPILMSGKFGGMAGAGAANALGAESLAFNPAGLSQIAPSGQGRGVELAMDSSPFFIQKKGPVMAAAGAPTQGAGDVWGKTFLSLSGGLFAAKQISESVGVGIGYFTAGGGGGRFGGLDFGPSYPALKPEFTGGLSFNDLSIGAGYQVRPGFRLGAAWRLTFIRAFQKAAVSSSANGGILYAFDFKDIATTVGKGFRLGAQIEPDSKEWSVGAGLRTGISFEADGTGSAQVEAAGSTEIQNIPGGRVTLRSSLPWQLAIGGYYVVAQSTRLFTQYEFNNYSQNHRQEASGDLIGGIDPSAFTLDLEWMNLHTIRLGLETEIDASFLLRGGGAILSQVTPDERANYGQVPPGPSYALTFGLGKAFFGNSLHAALAIDYSVATGTGRNSEPGFLNGQYHLWAVTAHSTLSYLI